MTESRPKLWSRKTRRIGNEKGPLGVFLHKIGLWWPRKKQKETYLPLKSVAGIPVTISSDCFQYQNFEINTLVELGAGTYGTVYEACEGSQNCMKWVAKVVEFDDEHLEAEQRNFLVEAILARVAGEAGFGVPVTSYFFCDQGLKGVIIMQRYRPVRKFQIQDYSNLLRKVKLMHDNHILHCDLFPRNVLREPETGDLRLIDFGLAFVLKKEVPPVLRVTDLAGFLFGQPPDLEAGVFSENSRLAMQMWELYREGSSYSEEILEEGLQMRLNLWATVQEPRKGEPPYRIDCDLYYDVLEPLIDVTFARKIGKENLQSRMVWKGADICGGEEGEEEEEE